MGTLTPRSLQSSQRTSGRMLANAGLSPLDRDLSADASIGRYIDHSDPRRDRPTECLTSNPTAPAVVNVGRARRARFRCRGSRRARRSRRGAPAPHKQDQVSCLDVGRARRARFRCRSSRRARRSRRGAPAPHKPDGSLSQCGARPPGALPLPWFSEGKKKPARRAGPTQTRWGLVSMWGAPAGRAVVVSSGATWRRGRGARRGPRRGIRRSARGGTLPPGSSPGAAAPGPRRASPAPRRPRRPLSPAARG